jgi:Na+/H+ antiporter NhaB
MEDKSPWWAKAAIVLVLAIIGSIVLVVGGFLITWLLVVGEIIKVVN